MNTNKFFLVRAYFFLFGLLYTSTGLVGIVFPDIYSEYIGAQWKISIQSLFLSAIGLNLLLPFKYSASGYLLFLRNFLLCLAALHSLYIGIYGIFAYIQGDKHFLIIPFSISAIIFFLLIIFWFIKEKKQAMV